MLQYTCLSSSVRLFYPDDHLSPPSSFPSIPHRSCGSSISPPHRLSPTSHSHLPRLPFLADQTSQQSKNTDCVSFISLSPSFISVSLAKKHATYRISITVRSIYTLSIILVRGIAQEEQVVVVVSATFSNFMYVLVFLSRSLESCRHGPTRWQDCSLDARDERIAVLIVYSLCLRAGDLPLAPILCCYAGAVHRIY